MKSNNPHESLRNFQIDDDLYYDIEFIAEQNNRNVKEQLTHLMKLCRDEFIKDRGIKKVPRTKKRLEKLKEAK